MGDVASESRKRRTRWGDGAVDAESAAAAELERTIAERAASIRSQIEEAQKRAAASRFPAPLTLDEQGRHVDAKGNLIVTRIGDLATVQANRPTAPTPLPAKKKVEEEELAPKANAWNDPRIKADRTSRPQRSFNFVRPGQFLKKGQNMRLRQLRDDLRSYKPQSSSMVKALDSLAAAGGNANMVALGTRKVEPTSFVESNVPDVEWWDLPLLVDNADSYAKVDLDKVGSLVQHPVPLKVRKKEAAPVIQSMMLTEKEKKKIKRMKKLEKQREAQDMVKLGLAEPPQPRITLKNMMRVLPNEAIEDPTAVEARARAEMEKRQMVHHLHNETRRLTPQQKSEKKRKKLEEDTSKEVIVALFRIRNLDSMQNRFKVSVSADQYKLTGCMILFEDCNLVIVEGGTKGIRKYAKLLLSRIKWNPEDTLNDDDDDDDEEDEAEQQQRASSQNQCSLVWKGMTPKRSFIGFRTHACVTAEQARKVLTEKNIAHYWDMGRNFQADQGDVIV